MTLTESGRVESAALDWFRKLGYHVMGGPDMLPGDGALRADYGTVVFGSGLREAVARLNPDLPAEALDDAVRRLTRPAGATLEARNRAFHRMLVEGVTVEYVDAGGAVRGGQVRAKSISTRPATTTGWRSTSSRSSRTTTNAGRTSCCSSTGCRWASSS